MCRWVCITLVLHVLFCSVCAVHVRAQTAHTQLTNTTYHRFGKLITTSLGFEGELNDVRPAGSEPLEWYFQMGAR